MQRSHHGTGSAVSMHTESVLNVRKEFMKCKIGRHKKRIIKVTIILLLFVLLFVVWAIWGNLTIATTYYNVTSEKIPSLFDGYKIVQISDLHNAEFGHDNALIIEIIDKAEPDIIVITGDLIDSSRTNIDIAVRFASQAARIAPCFYVTGNHEARIGSDYQQLEKGVTDAGVKILHDESVSLYKNGDTIQLIGLDDPQFAGRDESVQEGTLESKLKGLKLQDGFNLLLSHRPELFKVYVSANMDLVLSGHTHGGQFRLPFIGGIVAPDQGLFPKYDAGIFRENGTTMVISKGLGNSVIPFRLNNRPEIVIVELNSH